MSLRGDKRQTFHEFNFSNSNFSASFLLGTRSSFTERVSERAVELDGICSSFSMRLNVFERSCPWLLAASQLFLSALKVEKLRIIYSWRCRKSR